MTKKTKLALAALIIIILAGATIFIVLRLQQIGEGPVAPKPKAAADGPADNLTPASGCKLTFDALCKIPSPTPFLEDPKTDLLNSRANLYWFCNYPNMTEWTVKRYEYNFTVSGSSRTCGDPQGEPIIHTQGARALGKDIFCQYEDVIGTDIDKCVAYQVEVKDTTKPSGECKVASNNNIDCCAVNSNIIKICGLPANPTFLNRVGNTITYKDNSSIEDGFKVYERPVGPNNFSYLEYSDVPIVTLNREEGTGKTITYTAGDPKKYYSIRAYTNLCGRGGTPASPTPTTTPRATTTPTVTVTPGGPTATPTSTPTTTPLPTSTPVAPGEPYCDYITASPVGGKAALTVSFSGKGYDKTRIKGYRFTFGDGEQQKFEGSFTASHIQTVPHTYQASGEYLAQLEIMDDGDHWRTRNECKVVINVYAPTTTAAPTATKTPTAVSTPTSAVAQSTTAPTATKTPTSVIAQQPSPTEVSLPEAGIKIPSLAGFLGGFLLLAIGLVLVF